MLKIKVTGMDEALSEIRRLGKKLEELHGTHQLSIQELFPPSFMEKHTRFATIDAMLEASGFKVETTEDFAAIPDEAWDEYVTEVTDFDSWEAMLAAGHEDRIKEQLEDA